MDAQHHAQVNIVSKSIASWRASISMVMAAPENAALRSIAAPYRATCRDRWILVRICSGSDIAGDNRHLTKSRAACSRMGKNGDGGMRISVMSQMWTRRPQRDHLGDLRVARADLLSAARIGGGRTSMANDERRGGIRR